MINFCKETLLGGGRKLLSLWLCSLALTACNDDDSIIDRTGGNNLQIEVSANFHSRAPIHESTLPDNNPIGVTLTAKDGSSYDNQNYNNIPYSATTADGKQTWMPQDKPVTLSVTEGVAMAYWPYNADAADMTAVPVETDTQTDYMYSGNVTGLTNATPKAAFQMKHAMTLIRVNVVRGTYTAEGVVTAVTAASEAFCTSGSMNVSTGALAGLAGAETPFLEEPADAIITTAGRVTEFLVLPDGTVDAASVALGVTVDGRKYNTSIEVSEAFKQGYIYTYNLTLDNTALNVSGVSVTPWDLQSSVDTELNAQDDQYIVQVTIDSDNYNYIHNIQNFVGTIDWGDGTVQNIDTRSFNIEHNYAKAGKYIVAATGKATQLNSSFEMSLESIKYYPTKDISKLIHIGGEMGITSMHAAFQNQKKLTEIPAGIFDGMADLGDMRAAFNGCTGITKIPKGLFDKCTEVGSFWDTFSSCTGLTSIPQGLFNNNTKVTNFRQTFMNCSNITGAIPAGLFDNCSEVTTFQGTFAGCTELTGPIPAGLFDNNTKVESFYWTFRYCNSLTGNIPTGLFDNNTKVESFYWTFRYCNSLTGNIPTGLFDNNTEVTTFYETFIGCNGLTGTIPEGLFDNNKKVTNFFGLFNGCFNLTGNIPVGLFDNNTEVTTFGYTFQNCKGLTGIPTGLFDNNAKVTNFNNTFQGCTALTVIPQGLFDNCPEVTNFVYTFAGTGVVSIPEGLFDNNIKVTNFNGLFNGCGKLTTIPTELFYNCPDVTNFAGTFEWCTGLKDTFPHNIFDKCTKVTNFNMTFKYAGLNIGESPYTTIKVDGNDVKVHLYERANYPEHFTAPTDFYMCFYACDNLTDWAAIVAAGWN